MPIRPIERTRNISLTDFLPAWGPFTPIKILTLLVLIFLGCWMGIRTSCAMFR